MQAALMREILLSDIFRAYGQPACARQYCPTYVARKGSLHARGNVDRQISRTQAAFIRDDMLSDSSRAYRQPASVIKC